MAKMLLPLLVFGGFLLSVQGNPSHHNLVKRAVCSQDDQYGCSQWTVYCTTSGYEGFMRASCPATCGYCTAPLPDPPTNVQVQKGNCLMSHTIKRALHGNPALTWDDDIANGAAAWALHLAELNKDTSRVSLAHDRTTQYGENLYFGGSSDPSDVKTCTDAANNWYSEIKAYNYDNYMSSTGVIGHFTQVVWKSSTKLGVGIAKVKVNGMTRTFVVARYSPAGNMQGQRYYSENVPRPL